MARPNEDLIHAINGTDLIPALIPEIDIIIKDHLKGWYHTIPDTAAGTIDIVCCKEKFYPEDHGSRHVGSLKLDTKNASITCYGPGPRGDTLDLSDPQCFDKLKAWLDKVRKKNPWLRA